MRIAFRELRRRPGRFLFVGGALTLLAVLLLVLGGLLDGLYLGSTGAIRAQDASVFVYSSDAEESFLRSRITPVMAEDIATVDGVEETASLGVTLGAGRVEAGEDDDLLDLAVFGYEQGTDAVPAPPGPGEGWVDERLRAEGVDEGDVLLVGPTEIPVQVVGFVTDTGYLLQGSVWVDVETWRDVQAGSRPDAVMEGGDVPVLLVYGSGDADTLAARIDQALGDTTTSLTRDEAVLSLPGTQEQNATFTALIGTTFFVVGLITALFFVLLTVERTALYAAMKALGVGTPRLLGWSATQAVLIAVIAFVVGGIGALAIAEALPPSFPLRLEASRATATLVTLLATAALGSLIPLRRIVRIDPADAIS